MQWSLVPYYDTASHWKCGNIPNLVNDKKRSDASLSSPHCPSTAYFSKWFTQPPKSPFLLYFSGRSLDFFSSILLGSSCHSSAPHVTPRHLMPSAGWPRYTPFYIQHQSPFYINHPVSYLRLFCALMVL